MSRVEVAAAIAEVRERLGAAARRAGRDPGDVRLVAVTKGVPVTAVVEAVEAGVADLGESRAAELLGKVPRLEGRAVRWHFVGRTQRNKVGLLAPVISLWHSVDRIELGQTIARRAPGAEVLVEVNIDADPAKGGCSAGETAGLAEALDGLGLSVRGLMTIPRRATDPRPAFRALRSLADDLGLPELSMGMSEDFEAAVEEGATIVRVGRAIFEGSSSLSDPRPPGTHLQR